MFSQASVIQFTGGVCGGGAFVVVGMHGGGPAWQGVCVAGGVHGRGNAWQGSVHGRGTYVAGACVVGGHAWQGVCIAGETAIAASGMHPTGMHSCSFSNDLLCIMTYLASKKKSLTHQYMHWAKRKILRCQTIDIVDCN